MKLALPIIAAAGLLMAASSAPKSQSFEGVVEFTKTTGPVVTNYKYYVKGDHVRIEEISARGAVQGIMLVDLMDKTVTALSPDRKLFMDVPNARLPKDVKADMKKTGETRQMDGYSCEKWVAKCPAEDRQLTYWVAKGTFDFFTPMLQTLNRKDEQAVFFLKFADADGVFPMMGVEQKMDGTEVSRLEVTHIDKSEQKSSLFQIPKDYSKFERN